MKTNLMNRMLLAVTAMALLVLSAAAFNFAEIAPADFTFTPPEHVSAEQSRTALQNAELSIDKMRQRNFTTALVEDVLKEANLQYGNGNYTDVLRLTALITFIGDKKIEFVDTVTLTDKKAQEYRALGLNTAEADLLTAHAVAAFYKDQLVDAQDLLQQANAVLDAAKAEKDRQTTLINLSKNILQKYWWQILLALIVLGISMPRLSKAIATMQKSQKIIALQNEMAFTKEAVKRLQRECFIERKISTGAYKQKAAVYEARIEQIKHTIPVLEAQLKDGQATKRGILEVRK
ncbi:hypothetical protein HY492_03760 [Candidatus Woesearchaeota archaeon]|nr:hypothetical protein [Candidatus Woesearchaeota archaeon]